MNVLRDAAMILLAAEAFFCALMPLALSGGVVYGVWRLRRHRNLPTWLRIGREYVVLGLSYVELAMDGATKPIFAVNRALATVRGWIRFVTRRGGE
ncbi:MAG: hypothetical protein ACOC7Y_01540 [Chloroflexota bacterium]